MASRKFLVDIDLNKNQLIAARVENLGIAPGTPGLGQIFFDTSDNNEYSWNGTVWVNKTPNIKAQFDAVLLDGNFVFEGDSIPLSNITDVTATVAELNLLDLSGLTTGWALLADSATTASWKALPAQVTSWLGLTDTDPASYVGQAGKLVRVNATPDGLEFVDGLDLYAAANLTTLAGYGISDTKTNFNTALSDGTFIFEGDSRLTDARTPLAHTLSSHSDVTVTSIAAGEILKWSGSAWINNTLAEAGISPVGGYSRSVADLAGATVFDNVTVANGLVTNVATRDLTIANLGVTATLAELNVLDLSVETLTTGWVYAADGASAASWRKILGTEIDNTATAWTNNTGTVESVGISGSEFTIGGTNPVTTSGTISLALAADSVTNPKLANMLANTVKLNATAGSANPTDFAVTANSVLGRVAGNIQNILIDNDLSAVSGSHDTVASALAVKTYADSLIGANDAMVFKGTVGVGGTLEIAAFNALVVYDAGWTYKVITAGTVKGNVVEIGDMIISTVDRTGGGGVNADWTVIQNNLDGAVIGPSSAVNNNMAVYDGTSGKLIKDSGFAAHAPESNASTTAKGIVEEATLTEVNNATATGATGARLFVNPSTLKTSKYTRTYTTLVGGLIIQPVTHGLDNQFVQVMTYEGNVQVECKVTLTSSTVATLEFNVAPSASSIRVVVVG